MNREFLEELDAKTLEDGWKLSKQVLDGSFSTKQRYPGIERLETVEPYTESIKECNVYNQLLPHIGTLVVPLRRSDNQQHFERRNGFQIEDIDRLIEYSKNPSSNPKLRFVLDGFATEFSEMDYLEPVFREFSPPSTMNIPLGRLNLNDPEVRFWRNEGFLLAKQSQIDCSSTCRWLLEGMYSQSNVTSTGKVCPTVMDGVWQEAIAEDYASLRILGYEKLADEIAVNMWVNLQKSLALLYVAHELILWPSQDLLRGLFSFDKATFCSEKNAIKSCLNSAGPNTQANFIFPSEIGKFLNRNLKIVIPKNIDGVLEVRDTYKPADISSLVKALDQALGNFDTQMICENTQEISSLLEKTWKDASSLRRSANIARHGISFGLAVIGIVATLPIGGAGGILTSLGFEVIDQAMEKTVGSLSKKLASFNKPSYLLQIYDFQQKYLPPSGG